MKVTIAGYFTNSSIYRHPFKLARQRLISSNDDLIHQMKTSVFTFLLFIHISGIAVFSQEIQTVENSPPQISQIFPVKASPGVYLSVRGQHLLAEDDSDALIFFVQNGAEYKAEGFGGGSTDNDADGLQVEYLSTRIPAELLTGVCQVVVELKGKRSLPTDLKITNVTPPILTNLYADIVHPGTRLTIGGSGFSGSDTLELIDSAGRRQPVDLNTFSDSASFRVPEAITEGSVSLKVIEHRSGNNQESNRLKFNVLRGPIPLYLVTEWLQPAAPGQSLLLKAYDSKPIEGATRGQVMLTRGNQVYQSFIRNLDDPRITLPQKFSPGEIFIQNRIWQGSKVSSWSKPIPYNLQTQPAPPLIYNIQVWTPDSKAIFRQNNQIIAAAEIKLDGFPWIKIPSNLKSGTVSIEKHYNRAGRLIKEPPQNYSCCPLGSKNGIMSLRTWAKWNFPVTQNPPTIELYFGDIVIIDGDFLASRIKDVEAALVCGGRKFKLQSKSRNSLQGIAVKIPYFNAGDNNCRLIVKNVPAQVETMIMINLRIK